MLLFNCHFRTGLYLLLVTLRAHSLHSHKGKNGWMSHPREGQRSDPEGPNTYWDSLNLADRNVLKWWFDNHNDQMIINNF